jgi:gas vesicle protein
MAAFRFGNSEVIARRKMFTTALGCIAIGLGIGALAGLLTAPKNGKQMRKDMRKKVDDALDTIEKLGQRAGDLWERGEELAEVARQKVEPVTRILRRA